MINLKLITSKNIDEICELKADRSLVVNNEGSLAEAYAYWVEYGDSPLVYGIYDDEAPVGFLMVAYFEDNDYDNKNIPYYFLWRMMIDGNHQNKGYGREAMKLIIEKVKTLPNGESNAFYTSTNGEAALKVYEGVGFERTGVMRYGEIELRLAL